MALISTSNENADCQLAGKERREEELPLLLPFPIQHLFLISAHTVCFQLYAKGKGEVEGRFD